MIPYKKMYEAEYTDKELESFFEKFDYSMLDKFDSILYFAGFSYDTKDLVEEAKSAKERVIADKRWDYTRRNIPKVLKKLKNKELLLLYRLTDEAEMCAYCDGRYQDYYNQIVNIKETTEFEIEARIDQNKKKRLIKKR